MAQLHETLLIGLRNTRLVHQIRANPILPKQRRNLEALLKVPFLERYNIHVASACTPIAEGPLLFDKIRDRCALEGRETSRDPLYRDLDTECTYGLCFARWGD